MSFQMTTALLIIVLFIVRLLNINKPHQCPSKTLLLNVGSPLLWFQSISLSYFCGSLELYIYHWPHHNLQDMENPFQNI